MGGRRSCVGRPSGRSPDIGLAAAQLDTADIVNLCNVVSRHQQISARFDLGSMRFRFCENPVEDGFPCVNAHPSGTGICPRL